MKSVQLIKKQPRNQNNHNTDIESVTDLLKTKLLQSQDNNLLVLCG